LNTPSAISDNIPEEIDQFDYFESILRGDVLNLTCLPADVRKTLSDLMEGTRVIMG
jgi:hypothetical protein